MRNVLLTIAYDGSDFHGWQKQPNTRTVQGVLEETLAHLTGQEIQLAGTSRTDAGVHALGQRATMRGDFGIPTDRIKLAVNNMTEDVKILCAEDKPENFHARFNAKGKTYVYRVTIVDDNVESARIFLRKYRYLLKETPNIDKMYEAAKIIEGTHDFASFQAACETNMDSTVRTVKSIRILQEEKEWQGGNRLKEIDIEVTGDGFLYNMVRIIAGTLLEVGFGRRASAELAEAIEAKDRSRTGHTAPATGLYLKEVYFDDYRD